MLLLWIFIVCFCTMVYLEIIAHIQCQTCLRKTVFPSTRNILKLFLVTNLSFMTNYNGSVTTVYNQVIYII